MVGSGAAEMEKAYKIALENFEPKILAHKICAKNAHKCAKMPNFAKKNLKHLKNYVNFF